MTSELDLEARSYHDRIMKTTIDIPDQELRDAMRFTRARTKRDAVVTAIADFNRRRRMAELVARAGSCPDLMTVEELARRRRGD
jgi:Arc/MetJ family transcription regulator